MLRATTRLLPLARTRPLSTALATPLSQALPDLPAVDYADKSSTFDPYHTDITTLPNGLRVATSPHFGEFCTIGVCIDAGCRYEATSVAGVTHFLEKLAFGANDSYASHEQLFAELEERSGIVDCQSTRDTLIYASSLHTSGLETVTAILADCALRPHFTDEELELARHVVRYDLEDMSRDFNSLERVLSDFTHAAAYRGNTLGLPKICPSESIDRISRNHIYDFMASHFRPDKMVVSGIGVPHDEFVRLVEQHFAAKPAIWQRQPELLSSKAGAQPEKAIYTGGLMKMDRDLSCLRQGPNPLPERAHVVIGFESCSYHDPDFVSFCVLHALMGGGDSFSSGGPGKGMYTRLYLKVLNLHPWITGATSHHHVYADTGLYSIHGSCEPAVFDKLTPVIVKQFIELRSENILESELARAKRQLTSQLLMDLELRPAMFEDVARQVLGHGRRKSPLGYIEEIERVTMKDIDRVVDRMLSSRVSVAAYGKVNSLPQWNSIDMAIARRDIKLL